MQANDVRYRVIRIMKGSKKAGSRDKLKDLDRVLNSHQGKEDTLIANCVKTYGEEPPPEPFEERVTRFIKQNKPARAGEIPQLLKKYSGKELQLIETLYKEIGQEPEPPTPRGSAQSPAPKAPASSGGSNEVEQQKARLTRFYAHYAKEKTAAEIDQAVQKYAGKDGGFAKMWKTLEEKYGPEIAIPLAAAPAAATQSAAPAAQAPQQPNNLAQQKMRLRAFYDHYSQQKSDAEIDRAIEKYQKDPGGFDSMWKVLNAKYGPEPTGSNAKEAEKVAAAPTGGSAFVASSPKAALSPNDVQRDRLRRFYAKYAKEKTEEDISKAIERYSASPGGFEQMWATLEKKYGPEPANAPPPIAITIVKSEAQSQGIAPPTTDAWLTPDLLKHKERLEKFYAVYVPEKSEEEIVKALYRFKDAQGGLKAMWETLEKKYGPEPKDPNSELSIRDRLKKFYSHYAKEKTDADIDKLMKQYGSKPGGFDEMWLALERRYGVEDYNNPSAQPKSLTTKLPGFNYTKVAPPASAIDDDPSPSGKPEEKVRYGTRGAMSSSFSHGAAITVLHSLINFHGADFALYNRAPLDKRTVFREAIELDIADNISVAPRNVRVARIIAGPGGMLCEVEVELPMAEGAESIAEVLVDRINIGSFTVGGCRDAYRKALGGNPTQLYATEATVQVGQSRSSTMKTVAVQGRLLNREELAQKQPQFSQEDSRQLRAMSLLQSVPPAPSASFSPFSSIHQQQLTGNQQQIGNFQGTTPLRTGLSNSLGQFEPQRAASNAQPQVSPFLQSLWDAGAGTQESGAPRQVLQPYPLPSQSVGFPVRTNQPTQQTGPGLAGVLDRHYNFGSPGSNILKPFAMGGGYTSTGSQKDSSPTARDPTTFSNIVSALNGY